MSNQEHSADDPGTGPQRVRVGLTWPDGRSVEQEMTTSEITALLDEKLSLDVELDTMQAAAGDDQGALDRVARLRREVDEKVPHIAFEFAYEPVLRRPSSIDVAD